LNLDVEHPAPGRYIVFDGILLTFQSLGESEMAGVAGRFNRQFVVAICALLSAARLFAQEAGPLHSDNTNTAIVILLILTTAAVVAFGVLKKRSQRDRQIDSPGMQDPVHEAKTPETKPALVTHADDPIKSIFISYRRQDSQHITGRIYDKLSTQFGKSAVFKDVDSMPLGVDFRDHIREQVSRCAVLVAVIGKNWNETSGSGNRRLNDRGDHLRIEIEAALERRIPVIPVLVDGVEMPSEEELPPSLARLAYHHGISVRPDPDFHSDADRLLRGIESLLK
jgi:hypothetical protein